MSAPNYTFLPWVRYGLGNFIDREDQLSDPATERAELRVELKVENDPQGLVKEVVLAGPADVHGIQPEAIIRTEPREGTLQFNPNSLPFVEFYDEDFPWRYAPANPSAAAQDRLRPWLMLLVLKEEEFNWSASKRPLPGIVLTEPVLDIDPAESWAWAHVQVDGDLPVADSNGNPMTEAEGLAWVLDRDPDLALSRVICPRKLEPEKEYFAFLVPAFEGGRLAGLGQDTAGVPVQQPAWVMGGANIEFPFYHHFSFATSTDGDFETLARKLRPLQIRNQPGPDVNVGDLYDELGVAPINNFPHQSHVVLSNSGGLTSAGGFGDPIGQTPISPSQLPHSGLSQLPSLSEGDVVGSQRVSLEAAIVPTDHQHKWYGDVNQTDRLVRNALIGQINEADELLQTGSASQTEDPIVNLPPLYGRWLAAKQRLASSVGKLEDAEWIEQMNLDPAFRMAAGMGATVIRDQQDEFMEQAWDQIGDVLEANQKLRQSEMGREVGQRLFRKHLAPRSEQDQLWMTSGMHGKIHFADDPSTDASTIQYKVTGSTLPDASLDPAFLKLGRQQGPFTKRLNRKLAGNTQLQTGLVSGIADNTNTSTKDLTAAAARPKDEDVLLNPSLVAEVDNLVQTNTSLSSTSKTNATDLGAKVANQSTETAAVQAARVDFVPTQFTQSKKRLEETLEPKRSFAKQSMGLLDLQGGLQTMRVPTEAQPKPVMAHPVFPQPTFSFLAERYPEFMAPAIQEMEVNSVSIMKVNQPFIESFLTGMNHAMGAELLWREFPTDQRGSYFRQFWDTSEHLIGGIQPSSPQDIDKISEWPANSQLGEHGISGIEQDGKAVLLLRGELFRQYPNLVLYAQKAEWHNGQHRKLADGSVPTQVVFPLFRVQLANDLVGVGFQLTVNQVQGDLDTDGNPDPTGDAGWYFLFKERPGELKFGLDADNGSGAVISGSLAPDDLHWGHAIDSSLANPHNHIPVGNPVTMANNEATWGADSAEMAYVLHQRPVILGFHAAALI